MSTPIEDLLYDPSAAGPGDPGYAFAADDGQDDIPDWDRLYRAGWLPIFPIGEGDRVRMVRGSGAMYFCHSEPAGG